MLFKVLSHHSAFKVTILRNSKLINFRRQEQNYTKLQQMSLIVYGPGIALGKTAYGDCLQWRASQLCKYKVSKKYLLNENTLHHIKKTMLCLYSNITTQRQTEG